MDPNIAEFMARIRELEARMEQEVQERRRHWQADFESRKVRFEAEVLAQQKRFKMGLLSYVLSAEWRNVLSVPFIYPLIVPLVLLDLSVTLYQWVCFPLYRMARVKRSDYFVFDRTHLAYLNLLEKINCAYCSYGNGLLAYVREVVGRTEQYWCPIKHARKVLQAHPHYHGFADYGDAEHYREALVRLREDLARMHSDGGG
jgi:hypothetical protein